MQQDSSIPQHSTSNGDQAQFTGRHKSPSQPNKEGWRSVVSTLLVIVIAPFIAWLTITFVFQSYEVDGPSMEATLSHKDRLIVLKTQRTWSRITNRSYVPKRGEVIVFTRKNTTQQYGSQKDRQLIKRVIALPGERIVIKQGSVTVYNYDNPNGFNPDEDHEYGSTITVTNGDVNTIVPPGEVFVLGDNRTNSQDSRVFGAVHSEDIVGRLVLRIFPFNKLETF